MRSLAALGLAGCPGPEPPAEIPDDIFAPMGEVIDPDTIEIDFFPGGMGEPIAFHQVVDAGACEADAFYIAMETVFLCPEACAAVQADLEAHLEVRYGCDVGYIPQ